MVLDIVERLVERSMRARGMLDGDMVMVAQTVMMVVNMLDMLD